MAIVLIHDQIVPPQETFVSFREAHNSLKASLIPSITGYCRLILYICCPSSDMGYFPKKLRFLLMENGAWRPQPEHQGCSTLLGWSMLFRSFQPSKLENSCVFFSKWKTARVYADISISNSRIQGFYLGSSVLYLLFSCQKSWFQTPST